MPSSYRTTQGGSSRRRAGVRRALGSGPSGVREVLERGELVTAFLLVTLLSVVCSAFIITSRERPTVSTGQLMSSNRTNRILFRIDDIDATDARRQSAREASPKTYRVNRDALDALSADMKGLIVAIEGRGALDEIDEDIRRHYGLDTHGLEPLLRYVEPGGEPTRWWALIDRLLTDTLIRTPIIHESDFQQYVRTGHIRLLGGPSGITRPAANPIELGDSEESMKRFDSRMHALLIEDDFPGSVLPHIKSRLLHAHFPTIFYDESESERSGIAAADAITPVFTEYAPREIIYLRGDRLTPAQLGLLEREMWEVRNNGSLQQRWLPRIGVTGIVLLLSLLVGTFIFSAYPYVLRNMLRMLSIGLLLSICLGLTVVASLRAPQIALASGILATLFVSITVLLAYDKKMAIALGSMQAILVTLALGESLPILLLLAIGCGTMVGQVHDMKNRNSLIKAAAITGIVLASGSIFIDLLRLPSTADGFLIDIFSGAVWAGMASMIVGFLVLGMLPTLESLFDIMTGMSLAELRESSQPLLRELQSRAPGTYNHSLQVASLAEAGANAIDADAPLVYVGALYHDIGKMNKPEYFIENQSPGVNRHDALNPSMSLLILFGHVKDGMEMAREYRLPRPLHHFIESHHGTAIAAYFYRKSLDLAQEDDTENTVNEVDYRYPGPRPRTPEAAILMLSDAAESATRAASHDQGRIENIVRELSRERLIDGQFDECPLTLAELTMVEDAIIARLRAIYHPRIPYTPEIETTQTTDESSDEQGQLAETVEND